MRNVFSSYCFSTKKAQAAVEYTTIFGVGLVLVGILWVSIAEESDRTRFEIQLIYAKNAINKIADTADLISVQGPPAQTYISAFFPENIDEIEIQGNFVTFQIKYNDFVNNLTAISIANMTGVLKPTQGAHKILVKSIGNMVEITDG